MTLTQEDISDLIDKMEVYENHDYPVIRVFHKPDMEFHDTISEEHLEQVVTKIKQNEKEMDELHRYGWVTVEDALIEIETLREWKSDNTL